MVFVNVNGHLEKGKVIAIPHIIHPNKFQINQTFNHKEKNQSIKTPKVSMGESLLSGKVRSHTIKFNYIKNNNNNNKKPCPGNATIKKDK